MLKRIVKDVVMETDLEGAFAYANKGRPMTKRKGYRTLVDRRTRVTVEVSVDMEALCHYMHSRARRARRGVAYELCGAIAARVTGRRVLSERREPHGGLYDPELHEEVPL